MTDQSAPVAPILLDWATLPGDRYSAAAGMAETHQVVLSIPAGEPVDLLVLLRAGIRGLIAAEDAPSELDLALAAVAAGGRHVSVGLAARFVDVVGEPTRPDRAPLTFREIEVLQGITRGLTHRQVARRIGVTEATVHTYAKRLRRKLDAANKADLTRRAIELGYAEDGAFEV
ncbi:helix-turn-helix transcriptional regulator [Micromonospora sp. NBC_01813]|uniref:helix-turn-helix transcriptional regulator n=1 Tax=Micromonospora sp. NBC_01813 TaxID=2975988 RepID=UPI002DDC3EB8|nr:LuxR C-terminal-related transcriptional regulator [Micromonospora sp. NBC_01813]WSA07150.1 LuxR C-terminal-related transcriptional regulator [Micromonospora sp. NBC_01813]